MKKLPAIATAIIVSVSLILPMSVMADPNPNSKKPIVSTPHYDVNFVTGLEDSTYQILVPEDDMAIIYVVSDTEFGVSDWDATDVSGEITLPTGKTYDVWVQIRSKPVTSAFLKLNTVFVDTYAAVRGKADWEYFGEVGAGDRIDFRNYGCSNFATRWFEVD